MTQDLEIPALKVNQWLTKWNEVPFLEKHRKKPQPFFYVFTVNATMLKRLSKVYPRKADENRNIEIGVQRKHDPERSEKIRQYVFGGFPWSDLSQAKRNSNEFSDLKMPGWLPTAIIANILAPRTLRGGERIKDQDVISISEGKTGIKINLPKGAYDKRWIPSVPPIEIIDGQHRLWAFQKDEELEGEFEVPVVAFYDLDVSWQAYLFYTINIKPKKINASLAFDLYPILRVQDWLERSPDGAFVYKETRAQELVEVLWSYPDSPWKDRINMLGEKFDKSSQTVMPTITQAAFIRNLIASFIKTSVTRNLGGLYGAQLQTGELLYWNRTQQAAFLIFVWETMQKEVQGYKGGWANSIRKHYQLQQVQLFPDELARLDPAFGSRMSLMATDQGVRGFLSVMNDMIYMQSGHLPLNAIQSSDNIKEDAISHDDVKDAIAVFKRSTKLKEYILAITRELVKFDWRTASAEGLTEQERQKQMIYKGSSGYKEIRKDLLLLLTDSKVKAISSTSDAILTDLGYE